MRRALRLSVALVLYPETCWNLYRNKTGSVIRCSVMVVEGTVLLLAFCTLDA